MYPSRTQTTRAPRPATVVHIAGAAAPRRVLSGAAAAALVLLAATHVSANLYRSVASPAAAGTVIDLGVAGDDRMEGVVLRRLADLPAGSSQTVMARQERTGCSHIERWAAYDPGTGKLRDGVGRAGRFTPLNEYTLPASELRRLFRDPALHHRATPGAMALNFANAAQALRPRPDAETGL